MKQEAWNLWHQPVHEVVLFWAVGHLGTPEVISCGRSSVLFCMPGQLWGLLLHTLRTPLSAWTCSLEGRETWGEGMKHGVLCLILFGLISPSISLLSLVLSLQSSLLVPTGPQAQFLSSSLSPPSPLPFFCS